MKIESEDLAYEAAVKAFASVADHLKRFAKAIDEGRVEHYEIAETLRTYSELLTTQGKDRHTLLAKLGMRN